MKYPINNICVSLLIKDLLPKNFCCKKTGKACPGQCNNKSTASNDIAPRKLLDPLYIQLKDSAWYRPTSLVELYKLMNSFPGQTVRLVHASTSTGIVYGSL